MARTPTRNAGVLHRSAVTAVDKLTTPGTPTGADQATGGSLVFNTAYKFAISAGTIYGPTLPSTVASVTTANDAGSAHAMRVTIAQVTGATYYDIFLSTDAAPLWVARVTEAERLAGVTVTAVGTISATSPGAGKVDVRVPGSGVATTAAPFTMNNAVNLSGITAIDCTGYTTAVVYAYLTVTDLRSAPTLSLNAFSASEARAGVYVQHLLTALTLLSSTGNPLYRIQTVTINGAAELLIAVDVLTGQGASLDLYVDLV